MSNYVLNMLAATVFATQTTTTPAPPPKPPVPTVTLSGCVNPDAATPGSYIFSDSRTGAKYRLSGIDLLKDVGKRGQVVVGTGARSVTIRGGLVPSANVAGQAGAIDPSKAAIASAPNGTGSGTGTVQLPEFRATRVQAGKGACP